MTVDGLKLPDELTTLIDVGRWPRSKEEALSQNLQSWVPADRIRLIAPEESRIYFDPPPFRTAESFQQLPAEVERWFRGAPDVNSVPGDIDFSLAVVLGDFGAGSDAPFALDYRTDRKTPSVIRLRWSEGGAAGNRWVIAAQSFREFVITLGLWP